jgi:hypothetical protein
LFRKRAAGIGNAAEQATPSRKSCGYRRDA